MSKRAYKGDLSKPIRVAQPRAFEGAVTVERAEKYRTRREAEIIKIESTVSQEIQRKIRLLSEHYEIPDKKDMAALALALAIEHVPGFKVVTIAADRRGRKKKWDDLALVDLHTDVQAVKAAHHYNDRQALKFLMQNEAYREKWSSPPGRSQGQWVETLESRLQDAKKWIAHLDRMQQLLEDVVESVRRKKFRK